MDLQDERLSSLQPRCRSAGGPAHDCAGAAPRALPGLETGKWMEVGGKCTWNMSNMYYSRLHVNRWSWLEINVFQAKREKLVIPSVMNRWKSHLRRPRCRLAPRVIPDLKQDQVGPLWLSMCSALPLFGAENAIPFENTLYAFFWLVFLWGYSDCLIGAS